jgi:putative flippase GtrA
MPVNMSKIQTSHDRCAHGVPPGGGLSALLRHDVHPVVQFIKYGIVGGMATGVHITAFFLCGWFLFPCLTQNDITVRLLGLTAPAVSEAMRTWHAAFCNAIAFTLSNTVCYLLNRLFVFKPGRHHWALEFLFFFGASGVSLTIGTAVQTFLISHHGMQTTYAFGANLVSALLINYAMRKYVIFKG